MLDNYYDHRSHKNCCQFMQNYINFQCETYGVAAMDALHTHLLRPPSKIGIIGSGCSQATEPTAEISHYYNLTHVSIKLATNYISKDLMIIWISKGEEGM